MRSWWAEETSFKNKKSYQPQTFEQVQIFVAEH